MEQEFKPHPVLVNYEASRDGIVRNCRLKKPVGNINNSGYLRFTAGGNKKYYNHRIIYETFHGPIKDGLVIDHKNGVKTDNCLSNLQAISQSDNLKKGRTGTCKSVGKRPVEGFDTVTNEKKIFQSMYAAEKHFGIYRASVQFVAEGINQTAI
jgi:hypothetical protein